MLKICNLTFKQTAKLSTLFILCSSIISIISMTHKMSNHSIYMINNSLPGL